MKKIKRLYDSYTLKRKPPQNLVAGDDVCFGGPRFEYVVPESNVYFIKNACVSSDGFIIKNFKAFREFVICYQADFRHYAFRHVMHILFRFNKIRLNDSIRYMMVFDNYSGPKGFAHWLSDGLTRLIEIDDLLPEYTVLLPYYFHQEKIYAETLKYFKIKNSYYLPKESYAKVRQLYVARQIADSGCYHPENVSKLRKFIWDKTAVQKTMGMGERIYISRSKASRRFVTNEDEIIEKLKSMGFTVVCMEDYTFEKQVEIVYHAKILISIHGAALALIHFMQSGSAVLEFRKEHDLINGLFFSLSDALGVNYFYQSCKAIFHSKNANNFDLTVDPKELEKNIYLMLNRNSVSGDTPLPISMKD